MESQPDEVTVQSMRGKEVAWLAAGAADRVT
jgi:hypothetical protein